MEDRVFMKGNEAIAEAAVRAGCRFYAGYPITPQNEIPEYLSRRLPEVDGVFVQGESEIASVNMVYGAASTGTRAMTSSSSPGIALKSETISFAASARVPMVYCNVSRGGPGIGSIQPAQQDYLQATKASGNGGFKMIVLAPSTVQEAADLTYKAFEFADRDRNPVCVLVDGVIGTIMEPVVLPAQISQEEVAAKKAAKDDWACTGHDITTGNRMVNAGEWIPDDQMAVNVKAAAMYEKWQKEDLMVEEYKVDDAELVLTAYGISGRIAKALVDKYRAEGKKLGLIRPIAVNPFPYASFNKLNYGQVKTILDIEMSIPALMKSDVEMAVQGRCPIETALCSGGNIMKNEIVIEAIEKILK